MIPIHFVLAGINIDDHILAIVAGLQHLAQTFLVQPRTERCDIARL
jgi:hypothetical protein